MAITKELISELCRAVRAKETETSRQEVEGLASAACADLSRQGVKAVNPEEALTKQAIRLYVKAHYGYDENTERFLSAYEALSAGMALSGDYEEGG